MSESRESIRTQLAAFLKGAQAALTAGDLDTFSKCATLVAALKDEEARLAQQDRGSSEVPALEQNLKDVAAEVCEVVGDLGMFRLNGSLFCDSTRARVQVNKWLDNAQRMKEKGHYLPPMFASGLTKVGKTSLLKEWVPAEASVHSYFGVGKPNELRVLFLDLGDLPVQQGFQAMLVHLAAKTVSGLRKLGLATNNMCLTSLKLDIQPDTFRTVDFLDLFVDLPSNLLLLLDEAHFLLTPLDPATGRIDAHAQAEAGMLLKTLLCSTSKSLLTGVTASSTALFWLQVGKIPTNGIVLWRHGQVVHLPSRHTKEQLRQVLDDRLAQLADRGLSDVEREQLLAASPNGAFLSFALMEYLQAGASSPLEVFLDDLVRDKIMLEAMREWGLVLKDMTCEERRLFLNLALVNEGLDLSTLPLDRGGLKRLLEGLDTIPGTSCRYFAASCHREALQMLVDAKGELRGLMDFLNADQQLQIGVVDAFLHLLACGNYLSALREANQQAMIEQLLQGHAERLTQLHGDPSTWHEKAFFQEAMFAPENLWDRQQGPISDWGDIPDGVSGVAANYKRIVDKGTPLTAACRVDFYMTAIRNILAHVQPGKGDDGLGASRDPASSSTDGQGSGAADLSVNAVEALDAVRAGNFLGRCVGILSRSPLAWPFADVADRFQGILHAAATVGASPRSTTAPRSSRPPRSAGGSGRRSLEGPAGCFALPPAPMAGSLVSGLRYADSAGTLGRLPRTPSPRVLRIVRAAHTAATGSGGRGSSPAVRPSVAVPRRTALGGSGSRFGLGGSLRGC